MNYEQLKSSVQQVIKENGNEEITGNLLQQTLLAIISALGLGYQFMGEGTPETTPGTPDARVAYLCVQTGTYSNFGTPFTLDGTEIALCLYDTGWESSLLPIPTSLALDAYLKIANLATSTGDSEITSMTQKAITEALAEKEDKSNKVTSFSNPTDTQYPSAKLVSDSLNKVKADVSSLLTKAGIAEGIADTISAGTAQEFLQRQSGGDGVNCIKRINGKTIAWNQKIPNGNFAAASGWISSNASLTFGTNYAKMTASAKYGGIRTAYRLDVIAGHTYLISFDISTSAEYGHLRADWGNISIEVIGTGTGRRRGIVKSTPSSSGSEFFWIHDYNDSDFQEVTIYNVFVVDLTLLGLGDLTADQFRALYPALYYAPASVLKGNDAAALLTDGRNQWDEEWELGDISRSGSNIGQNIPASNIIRSKNYIPVFPSLTYFVNKDFYIYEYDADYNFVFLAARNNTTFGLQPQTAFIRFVTRDATTTYNNDICINISDPSFNGTYQPYWKRVLALRLSELTGIPEGGTEADRVTMFPNGAGGAGSAFDSIFVENGVTKARKRMLPEVDLGDLDYVYESAYSRFSTPIEGIKRSSASRDVPLICSKYIGIYDKRPIEDVPDKSCYAGAATDNISIKDTAYSDAATFKAAMAGVKLLAESATPIVYTDLQYADGTPFTMPATILVDNYGTERIQAPEGATTPSAPFCCDSNYSIGIANLVKKLAEL